MSYKKNTNVPEKRKESNNIISKNVLQMSTIKLDDLLKTTKEIVGQGIY